MEQNVKVARKPPAKRQVSINVRKVPEHRVKKSEPRSIKITYGEGGWHYAFTGRWNAHLLQKVAKGLRRGWIRDRHQQRPKRVRHESAHARQEIPRERPDENLGTNPRSRIMGAQPTMPLAEGTSIPTVGPLVEPDAASMQPQQITKKKEENNEVSE